MRSIFDACHPREDVLSGELREDVFAAKLETVARHQAAEAYQSADVFFTNTYPTAGLKALLDEAIGRLTGARRSAAPILRLETSFGGGKTHNLIALYHAACGHQPPEGFTQYRVPEPGTVRPVAFVGGAFDPVNGERHGEITTYTLWGDIAHALGDAEGYALVAESDERRIAPGYGFLDDIVGDRPALILIDELARHLESCAALEVGASNQARQSVAFLMTLLEWAASKERVVVAYTLADDAFEARAQDVQEALDQARQAQRISARQEHVITPAGDVDVVAIVNHRLFATIDRDDAGDTAATYHRYLSRAVQRDEDVPTRVQRAEYRQTIESSYPLHPELIQVLQNRLATHPNFQRTRGALRLLATVIRDLWTRQPAGTYLIHPYHVNLSDGRIAEELTSRLGLSRFSGVIEADIAGTAGAPAHAQQVDADRLAVGDNHHAQHLATTIFLHSLVSTRQIAGVNTGEALLGVLTASSDTTGDEAAVLKRALADLVDRCWYLDYDGQRYRFTTEPSLRKIVDDEMATVHTTTAKAELDERIRGIWRPGELQPVPFPDVAADIPDDDRQPKLAIMHYDGISLPEPVREAPDLIRQLYDHAGRSEAFRQFRNNVLFLVCDGHYRERMLRNMKRVLAVNHLLSDRERMAQFNHEQQEKLRQMSQTDELELRISITQAYRYLYYPSSERPGNDPLTCETLTPQTQGDPGNQTPEILQTLVALDKAYAAGTTIAAQYLSARVWDGQAAFMTTIALRRAFARKTHLRILLDVSPLKRAIRDGVDQGLWGYLDTNTEEYYHEARPLAAAQIGEEYELLRPEEAQRRGLPREEVTPQPGEDGGTAQPELLCPVCHMPVGHCVCGVAPHREPLRGEGLAQQALTQLRDRCTDQNIERLGSITLRLAGTGPENAQRLRALGLALPSLNVSDAEIALHLTLEFADRQHASFDLSISWDRYRQAREALDALARQASNVDLQMTIALRFAEGLSMSDSFWEEAGSLLTPYNLGSVTVTGAPAGEPEAA